MIILFFIVIILFIYLTFIFFPKIKYNKFTEHNLTDKLNLDKDIIKNLVTFRSYIHYTRFLNLNTDLMDKKKLYDFLKSKGVPHPQIYYHSNNNFKIRNVIDNLILNNKNFVIKPTNLSEKVNCVV